MFQKLYPASITLLCLALMHLGGGAYAWGEQEVFGEIVTQRWMLTLEEVDRRSQNDSVVKFLNQNQLGGILYQSHHSLSEIAAHIALVEGGTPQQLLIGLNLSAADQKTYRNLGLTPPSVLAAVADDDLIRTAASRDAVLLRAAGIDFVMVDLFRLSFWQGYGEEPEAVKQSAVAYLKALAEGGIDVVGNFSSSAFGELRLPLAEELSLYKEAEIRGVNISSLQNQPVAFENGYEATKFLAKEFSYHPITFSTYPSEKAWSQDLKNPVADFLFVSPGQAFHESARLADAKIKYKKQKAVAGKISQWKLQRLLLRSQPEEVMEAAGNAAERSFAFQLNLKSATLLANAEALIPFKKLENQSFATSSFGDVSKDFLEHMHKYASVTEFAFPMGLMSAEMPAWQIAHFDNYIAAIDLAWFDALSHEEQARLLVFLIKLQKERTKVTLVLLGLSENLELFAGIEHISYHPVGGEQAERLAPQLLFGAYGYSGRWNGSKELFPNASSTASLARLKYGEPWMRTIKGLNVVDSIAIKAIADKATPGCQILVAKGGVVLYEKAFGYLSYDSLMPVTNETLYDLASLTKVSATLQALMILVDQGKIDIKSNLGAYIKSTLGTNKERLIVEDVLLHQAGLKPYIPFWQRSYESKRKKILDPMFFNASAGEEFSMEILPGMYSTPAMKDSVWRWTLQTDLMTLGPKDSVYTYKYSDLGFMIIQKLVEEVAGMPLDEFVSKEVYKPLGMDRLCFQPLCSYPYQSIAPTELDFYFRKNMVWGTVHDENAAIMGGVAGHAGLFGNANSLAILLQMHLQKGYYGGKQYVDNKTVDLFTQRLSNNAPRALGWDMKDLSFTRNNTSFWSSETTYGHTGFTGTAVWVDPEMELIYIFLSNRVHPDAHNNKLVETNIRTRIQDVIYQSLGWQLTSGE
ncbi:MAG: serine hydrolase [Imperialibacter sp.]|uniref:serine hydrolase n=1 Tax=Imperialibacter sp. TaxID=2038411 RepID=UPI0032EFFCCD